MILAATQDSSLCLACGGLIEKKSRTPANKLPVFLKTNLSMRCEANHLDVDLDHVINVSFVCRCCFNKYMIHQEKDSRLYETTAKVMDYISGFEHQP